MRCVPDDWSLSSPGQQHLSDVVFSFFHAAFKVHLLLLEITQHTVRPLPHTGNTHLRGELRSRLTGQLGVLSLNQSFKYHKRRLSFSPAHLVWSRWFCSEERYRFSADIRQKGNSQFLKKNVQGCDRLWRGPNCNGDHGVQAWGIHVAVALTRTTYLNCTPSWKRCSLVEAG